MKTPSIQAKTICFPIWLISNEFPDYGSLANKNISNHETHDSMITNIYV